MNTSVDPRSRDLGETRWIAPGLRTRVAASLRVASGFLAAAAAVALVQARPLLLSDADDARRAPAYALLVGLAACGASGARLRALLVSTTEARAALDGDLGNFWM